MTVFKGDLIKTNTLVRKLFSFEDKFNVHQKHKREILEHILVEFFGKQLKIGFYSIPYQTISGFLFLFAWNRATVWILVSCLNTLLTNFYRMPDLLNVIYNFLLHDHIIV